MKNNYDLDVIYGEDNESVRVKELKNKDDDVLYELESFTYKTPFA